MSGMNPSVQATLGRRGWIIRCLKKFRAAGAAQVNDRTLMAGLAGAGYACSEPTLYNDLAYLAEKGYVRTEQRSVAAVKVVVAEVTARGIDLYDGVIDADPGVDFLRMG